MGRKKIYCNLKRPIGVSVTNECIDALRDLAAAHNVSMSVAVEYAFRIKMKKLPANVKDLVKRLPRD